MPTAPPFRLVAFIRQDCSDSSQGELLGEDDMDDEMISVMDGYGRRRRYMGGYGGSGRRRRKRSANWIPRDSTQ